MNQTNEWVTIHHAWSKFTEKHPELGYKEGMWQVHNFLRIFREDLVMQDAIRKARGRHWIANASRFSEAAFNCATSYGLRSVSQQ